jgi:hypothetical protein
MLLAFKILLYVFVVLFGLASIGDNEAGNRLNHTCITIASILALCVTFFVN